jgi:hypothetical protein
MFVLLKMQSRAAERSFIEELYFNPNNWTCEKLLPAVSSHHTGNHIRANQTRGGRLGRIFLPNSSIIANMVAPQPTRFNCPNCAAKYKVVRIEAPATIDLEMARSTLGRIFCSL